MSPFQVLSTKIDSDGWVDMNIRTPYGIVSIELRIDGEAVQLVHISNDLPMDKNNQSKNRCYTHDELIESLVASVQGLADQKNIEGVSPVKMTPHDRIGKKQFRILTN